MISLPPAMPPNWKAPLSVVDTLIRAFAGGTGNNVINGFVIREICCAYIWKEKKMFNCFLNKFDCTSVESRQMGFFLTYSEKCNHLTSRFIIQL